MVRTLRTVIAALASMIAIHAAYANEVYFEARPILETKNGKLQGVERNGMVMFKDIPYAAPPVGELLRSAARRSTAENVDCTRCDDDDRRE